MDSPSIFLTYKFLLPPIIGCAIGWATNYVAIKLLFKPHEPVKVFGLKFQGLIPKRRKEIARSIARAIEKELLNSDDIAGMLKNIEWKKEVEHILDDLVDHRLSSERLKKLPLVGLVTDNLSYHLKYLLTKEVLRQIDLKKDSIAKKFRDNVNIRETLISRIDQLDVMRFEGLLTQFISKELKHLEYLGGVMGFIIGLAQSVVFLFLA